MSSVSPSSSSSSSSIGDTKEAPKTKRVYLALSGHPAMVSGHITLIWMGERSDKEVADIKNDYLEIQKRLETFGFIVVNMGKWAMFGQNKDVPVRLCTITDIQGKLLADLLDDMYKKWYYHAPGECARRLKGPSYHITPEQGKISHSEVEALSWFNATSDHVRLVVKDIKPVVNVQVVSPPSSSSSSSSTTSPGGTKRSRTEKKKEIMRAAIDEYDSDLAKIKAVRTRDEIIEVIRKIVEWFTKDPTAMSSRYYLSQKDPLKTALWDEGYCIECKTEKTHDHQCKCGSNEGGDA